jgi:hypothetical protein
MNYPTSEHKIISQAELDEKDGYIASLERAITTCAKKRVLLAEENERLQERLTAVYGENERLREALRPFAFVYRWAELNMDEGWRLTGAKDRLRYEYFEQAAEVLTADSGRELETEITRKIVEELNREMDGVRQDAKRKEAQSILDASEFIIGRDG